MASEFRQSQYCRGSRQDKNTVDDLRPHSLCGVINWTTVVWSEDMSLKTTVSMVWLTMQWDCCGIVTGYVHSFCGVTDSMQLDCCGMVLGHITSDHSFYGVTDRMQLDRCACGMVRGHVHSFCGVTDIVQLDWLEWPGNVWHKSVRTIIFCGINQLNGDWQNGTRPV